MAAVSAVKAFRVAAALALGRDLEGLGMV